MLGHWYIPLFQTDAPEPEAAPGGSFGGSGARIRSITYGDHTEDWGESGRTASLHIISMLLASGALED